MPQTSTRLARLEDLPILAVFEREVARANFPQAPLEDLTYHTEKLKRAFAREPEGMVVLVDAEGGDIVAWLWLSTRKTLATGERYGVIKSLYVRPSQRRLGLGTLLAHYAVRHFAQREIDRIVATVHSGNLAGARTLAKGGFESCHVTYERSGVAGEEAL